MHGDSIYTSAVISDNTSLWWELVSFIRSGDRVSKKTKTKQQQRSGQTFLTFGHFFMPLNKNDETKMEIFRISLSELLKTVRC